MVKNYSARIDSGRAGRYGFAAILLVAVGVIFGAQPAFSHSALVDSNPKDGATILQAPGEVALVFNEQVRNEWPEVVLTVGDSPAAQLQPEVDGYDVKAKVPDELAAKSGKWVVAYRVVSADGHPVEGSIAFTVNSSSASSPASAPAAGSGETRSPAAGDASPEATAGTEESAASETDATAAANESGEAIASGPVATPQPASAQDSGQNPAGWWIGGIAVVAAAAAAVLGIRARQRRNPR